MMHYCSSRATLFKIRIVCFVVGVKFYKNVKFMSAQMFAVALKAYEDADWIHQAKDRDPC
jgi:Na+(H+)/acetate symporter ActP